MKYLTRSIKYVHKIHKIFRSIKQRDSVELNNNRQSSKRSRSYSIFHWIISLKLEPRVECSKGRDVE